MESEWKQVEYLPVVFVGLAIAVLVVVTNQQRETFGFGQMPQAIDLCTLHAGGSEPACLEP